MRTTTLLLLLIATASLPAKPLQVFVSVPPQKTFVAKMGGAHVAVHTMVRPGYNPATYDPSPQQIAALANAKLYIGIGVPFEASWMERIRSASPEMLFLDARTGIDLRHEDKARPGGNAHTDPASDDHHHHGNQGERDPHIWTSPPLVKHMARSIRDKLTEIDPRNAQDYARRYVAFANELDALDREIRALFHGLSNRKFMVFHPAWGYFADAYGLTQVAIEQARREDMKIVFVQPQFDRRSATQLARAIGGRVLAIDPLASDYLDNLRHAAKQLAEALQR